MTQKNKEILIELEGPPQRFTRYPIKEVRLSLLGDLNFSVRPPTTSTSVIKKGTRTKNNLDPIPNDKKVPC